MFVLCIVSQKILTYKVHKHEMYVHTVMHRPQHSMHIWQNTCNQSAVTSITAKLQVSRVNALYKSTFYLLSKQAAGFDRHGMPPPVCNPDLWPFDLKTGVRVASKYHVIMLLLFSQFMAK